MIAHIEDNKKSSLDKIAALEKFILSIKDATERTATQIKPQSQVEASLNLMEDVRSLVSRTDSLSYKFDALNYDLSLIKSDIVRQQRAQQGYFEKVDKLEKKIDVMPIGNSIHMARNMANTSSGNFMANASRTVDDGHFNKILQPEMLSKDGSASTQEPLAAHYQVAPPASKVQKNYFMEEELDREFGKDHFGGNLSIIDKGQGRSGLIQTSLSF